MAKFWPRPPPRLAPNMRIEDARRQEIRGFPINRVPPWWLNGRIGRSVANCFVLNVPKVGVLRSHRVATTAFPSRTSSVKGQTLMSMIQDPIIEGTDVDVQALLSGADGSPPRRF